MICVLERGYILQKGRSFFVELIKQFNRNERLLIICSFWIDPFSIDSYSKSITIMRWHMEEFCLGKTNHSSPMVIRVQTVKLSRRRRNNEEDLSRRDGSMHAHTIVRYQCICTGRRP